MISQILAVCVLLPLDYVPCVIRLQDHFPEKVSLITL